LSFEVKRKDKVIKLPPLKPELHKDAAENTKDDYKIGVLFVPELKVAGIIYGSPAEQAGVQLNDIVQKINGIEVKNFKDFKENLIPLKNKSFVLNIKRDKKNVDIKLAAVQPRIYDVGISIMILDHPTPWQQFMNVVDMSYKSLRGLTVTFLNYIGVSKKRSSISTRNLSGPIGLATTLYESVRIGTFRFGLYFVVLVSFALAIFNLLPLPVLDGGHMTLALIEIIIRKPVHEGTVKVLTFIFIFLLIGLMIYVTYFDILRRLSPEWQNRLDPDQTLKKTENAIPAKTVIGNKNVKETPVKTN
jgi:regulator of sigma E protease